jgi:hypothetical protein
MDMRTMMVALGRKIRTWLEFDYMEYSSDALAQAEYVTNASYGPDLLYNGGGTVTADLESGTYYATNACDGNDSTFWLSGGTSYPHWWKYDFGSGVTKQIRKLTLLTFSDGNARCKDFTLQGSNDNTNWTTIYTGQMANENPSTRQVFTFSNSIGYRYYMVHQTSTWNIGDNVSLFCTIQMMELSLQSYSESTIKTQGSYSLKAVAAATDSLNKTLTKTFSPALDLSGKTQIKFDIRASRTGSNIKLGFHDSGGTTTEVTPNITSADTFQTVTVDISAVADADKDAIDSLIITIVNADSANTIYIDNVRYS